MYARYRDMVGGVDCALCLERAAGHGPCLAGVRWRSRPWYRVGLWIFGQHETDTRIISDFEP